MECAIVNNNNNNICDVELRKKRRAELDRKIRDNGLARIGSTGSMDELLNFYSSNAKDYAEVS